jgi:DNA repair photolyase
MDKIDTMEKLQENIIGMPNVDTSQNEENIPTPKSDKVIENALKMKKLSKYQTDYDFEIYRKLELRFGHDQPKGGVVFGSNDPFKLINTHKACQQCLYAFEMDTYGRGCVHDCAYCYSKAELTVRGYWNKPFPMPRDITTIWKVFYTVFETDKKSKWRDILEKRIPLRIGSGSDGFMFMDRKYRVTYELLKILKFYNYPYIIVTRSDLVAHDDYLEVLDPDLAAIQLSIPSLNDKMNKQIEPGAPSAKRRLNAIKKLTSNGFWTTVRINPLFPIHPDGYFTDPNFPDEKRNLKFDYFNWDLIQAISEHGGQSLLAGMVRLSGFGINNIEKATGVNLKPFFKQEARKSQRDFHFSEKEIRAYYERIHAQCKVHGIEFTTCYIGNGESMFWSDQDLWDNKKDCCNAQGRIKGFSTNSRNIGFNERTKLSAIKMPPVNKEAIDIELGKMDLVKIAEQYSKSKEISPNEKRV